MLYSFREDNDLFPLEVSRSLNIELNDLDRKISKNKRPVKYPEIKGSRIYVDSPFSVEANGSLTYDNVYQVAILFKSVKTSIKAGSTLFTLSRSLLMKEHTLYIYNKDIDLVSSVRFHFDESGQRAITDKAISLLGNEDLYCYWTEIH